MSTSQTEKKTILVVDDDPFIQRLFRKTLEREGFQILSAADGAEAIGMLPNLAADLIILDLMLPKIHGLKVLEAIRSTARTKDFPVLILSNAYLPEVAQKAMKAGANMGLPKSECSPARLIDLVRQMITVTKEQSSQQPAAKKSLFSRLLSAKPETPRNGGGDMTAKAADALVMPEARNELAKEWQTEVATIRQHCLSFVKSVGTQEASDHLNNLYRSLRFLSARAAMGRCTNICQLASSFEAMLFEHVFRIKSEMSPSVTQTMVQAVDCLEHLFKTGAALTIKTARKSKVLLVDDDPVCNSANDIALRRADFETVSVTDGMAALTLCETTHFDLILLDINMPILSGFEVCEKIRAFPLNKHTPVIFVTLHGDFQNRAQSVLSGASGLITKPISPLELIVKAMVFLLRSQRHNAAKEHSHANKDDSHAPAPAPTKLTVKLEPLPPMNGTIASERPLPAQNSGNLKTAASKTTEGHQTSRIAKEHPKLEGRVKELQATQAAVDERVKALTEALAAETKKREEAEKQAALNAKRRNELEGALAENQKAHKSFEQLLEKTRQQVQTSPEGQTPLALRGQARELESVRIFVEQKNSDLARAIATETKRRESAEKEAAEFAKRHADLEAALAACQEAKAGLLHEIEVAKDPVRRSELEAALRENAHTHTTLLRKIEETRQQLQPSTQDAAPAAKREAQIAELQAARSAVEEKVKVLTQELAAEKKRRETAEQEASAINKRHGALEAELAEGKRTQTQVHHSLEDAQKQLRDLLQASAIEQERLSAKEKELQAAQKAVEAATNEQAALKQQMQTLTGSLKSEFGRRQTAEKEATDLAARRNELEKELARHTRAQEEMCAELLEQKKRLDAQAKNHEAGQATLASRTKELETAQAELAKLKAEHKSVIERSRSLAESLETEASRRAAIEKQAVDLAGHRTELEQNLTRHLQAQEKLQNELAEQRKGFDSQNQNHEVERANLTKRVQELESSQVALAELRSKHANVSKQADSLAASLKAESARREAVEKQAADLAERRAELERNLAERAQAQERLQTELAAQQKLLASQSQKHEANLGVIQQRAQELEAAQTALAGLQAQHASVSKQAHSLAESLKSESARRAAIEKQAADLNVRQAELERELAERSQREQQLQTELAARQVQLETQGQTHQVELGNLQQRTRELEAAQTALAALKARHSEVISQSKSLAASLATESGRREATEGQVAEMTRRRAELEEELARQTKEHEQLRTEFAALKNSLNAQAKEQQAGQARFTLQSKELETAQTTLVELRTQLATVRQQVETLKESSAHEFQRCQASEKQAVELAIQRAELERELALQTHSQAQLRAELDEHKKRFDAQTQAQREGEVMLVARTKELEASQATATELSAQHAIVRQQVQTLGESLKAESARREVAEKQATELSIRRAELEKELAQRTQNQEQLQAEVAGQKKQLAAHAKTQKSERANLAARTKELEAAQAAVAELKDQHAKLAEQVSSLTSSLKTEAGHRKTVEKQAAELVARRKELEADIAHRSKAQRQLSAELSALRTKLDSEAEARTIGLNNLAVKSEELQAAQTALAELRARHASASERAETLAASLTTASEQRDAVARQAAELTTCRTALELELSQRTQAQQQLSAEVAALRTRLDFEVEANAAGRQNLSAKTAELKTAQTTLAELKAQYASATGRIEMLTTTLKAESDQREAVEKQAAGLVTCRTALERELEERAQALEKLGAELIVQQQQFNAQGQSHEVEVQTLNAQVKELETAQAGLADLRKQHADIKLKAGTLTSSLEAETGRRKTAEQQAAELAACRVALEHKLAEQENVRDQLRAEIAAQQQQLEAHARAQKTNLEQLAERTKWLDFANAELLELKARHVTMSERLETLTRALEVESARRGAVEKQAAELADRCSKLEQELALHEQTEERLHTEMAEQAKQIKITSDELDGFRNRDSIQGLKLQKFAEQLVESERARTELGSRLEASHALASGREKAIQALGAKLQQRSDEYERLDMLLRAEVTHRHRIQSQFANAESQLAEFGRELVQKSAAEQSWLKREAELQTSLRFQQDEAAKAGTALASREVEITQARAKIEELQVLQSALCTKVRELTRKDEAAAAQVQELQETIARSENTAAQRQKHLAALRYAILDSSRTSSRRQRERSQAEQQQLAALRRLLWTFENTPLSTAQRRMLAEIQSSVGNLKSTEPDVDSPYPVELPELHQGEFCATEVIESAFRIVRARSGETGIIARTSASGATGGTLYGDAVYIHQLIVLLASSPIGMDDVSALDLRVGIERMTASSADLTVRVALSTKASTQNLRARIEFISSASANLKAGSFGEPESALAAGWQLAQALGAQVAIETEGNSEVCITLSLPIEMQSRIATQTDLPVCPPSANGNDHETHDTLETVPAR